MTRLVLLHGRDNQGLDPEGLERTWRTVLAAGLAGVGEPRGLTDDDATFVYYGDTLAALARGGGAAPPVTVHALPAADVVPGHHRATDLPADELAFLGAVAAEVLGALGPDDDRARALAVAGATTGTTADPMAGGVDVQELGTDLRPGGLDLGAWVNALLAALDHVPGLSAGVLVLLVRDVWAYVHDDDVRSVIDDAVAAAMPTDEPAVVVGHSLGSVVAYSVLREHAGADAWDVPLFLTLGSPLAIRAIRDVLAARAPLRVPAPVRRWVAARDPRDALAVHDLGPDAFPLAPGSYPVEDLVVANDAPGHHAAAVLLDGDHPAGYLATPAVARALAAALPPG
ncbi:hypothetical protein [Cellulosimicrobium arenosum]|uniref:Uncharacterized protein n=1 Tax=Cellulosimicrobium arenosum TaxID=2708133 RepID=A0A927IYN8_9MICO|nr:hypothetical protein [Cellulosimicrobium arenosum]MBD8078591.1 hypothetical protein [Cellulosimicrobium arenosum]